MSFDRFHIVEVYYWYLSLNYAGQGSREYARLSKLTGYYKPGMCASWDNLPDEVKNDVNYLQKRNGKA